MKPSIPLYMWRAATHPNLGDELSPYIIQKLTGRQITIVPKRHPNALFAIGSILGNGIHETQTVWGSGFLGRGNFKVASKIFCLRGPLSLYKLENKVSVPLGDPALMLPRVYQSVRPKKYDIGIIPHYVDQEAFMRRFNIDTKDSYIVLNTKTADVEKFVDKISGCRFVVSSSLHGLILAHAYNIPAVWIEISDQVIGGGFKFADYLLSVGLPFYAAGNFKSGEIKLSDLLVLESKYRRVLTIKGFDDAALLESLEHAIAHVDSGVRAAQERQQVEITRQ